MTYRKRHVAKRASNVRKSMSSSGGGRTVINPARRKAANRRSRAGAVASIMGYRARKKAR